MLVRQRFLDRKATAMTVVVAFQSVAAFVFSLDFITDVVREGMGSHLVAEGLAAIALVIAVIVGAIQVRSLVLAARREASAVALARGAVADLIKLRFAEWHLTPSEADVALFAIKGCDGGEIARLRGAAAGTVRAQLTHIYAKAGVGSQSALVALFLDDVIDPVAMSTARLQRPLA